MFNNRDYSEFMKEQAEELGLGPKGTFSQPKVNNEDCGELTMAMAVDAANQLVVVNFGIPVSWLGFSADEARSFATCLVEKAAELEKEIDKLYG